MPYTSPLSSSPASSSLSSPSTSRRSSIQIGMSSTVKSDLPRSTSYLARHRRTGSIQASISSNLETSKYMSSCNEEVSHQKNLRSRPSCVVDGEQAPDGVIVSPPKLPNDTCNDEALLYLSENSQRCKNKNLDQQRATIAYDSQNCEASQKPASKNAASTLVLSKNDCSGKNSTGEIFEKKGLTNYCHKNNSNNNNNNYYYYFRPNTTKQSPVLLDNDSSSDDEEDEINLTPKSSMVRKKSGELVRPALRPPVARRRPSSMPGTPTFSKAVHFDSQLEHIRHFLQVDRPLAVSAGSSPVPNYDSDTEFPFGGEYPRELPFEWELVVSKFPAETPERLAQAVRVERVFLSNDNKILVGSVIVANLAYKKSVVVRFTLDYWKTTSEVVADFNQDSRQPIREGYDRFNFNIKLSDLANLDAKTMFFCVKYFVNGQVFWDNNNNTNFQLDFRKKMKVNSSTSSTTTNPRLSNSSLPRSNHRSTNPRPSSMPLYFDDYADGFDQSSQFIDFKNAIEDCMDEPKFLKPKRSKSKQGPVLETPTRNIGQANGNAFGNRYDFGASLNAAIKASNIPKRDQESLGTKASDTNTDESVSPLTNEPLEIAQKDFLVNESTLPVKVKIPGLSSQSYTDLLDKYCFFGSEKTSPQLKDGNMKQNITKINDRFGYLYNLNKNTSSNSQTTSNEYNHLSSNQRINQSSPPITSRLMPSMFPAYQNLHEGYPFLETHAATAIRGQ
ncbi:putative protein phosphatase regulator [Erysiphe neolycopersici]|uniref:CBM21 domain-containing protein n=1 Tax=Erysiphe neolycopersici TaxID=212602 RepID=A0A420HJQ5_9PEZI|nr:putative protein phosphatase regulator [Erysiphe neolycopersici]